jgi:hypothetical protein
MSINLLDKLGSEGWDFQTYKGSEQQLERKAGIRKYGLLIVAVGSATLIHAVLYTGSLLWTETRIPFGV